MRDARLRLGVTFTTNSVYLHLGTFDVKGGVYRYSGLGLWYAHRLTIEIFSNRGWADLQIYIKKSAFSLEWRMGYIEWVGLLGDVYSKIILREDTQE